MFPLIDHTAGREDCSINLTDAMDIPSPYRSRGWERRHLDEKVVYRGVKLEYVKEVQRLASDLSVPQGEVARSILEYSLRRYEQGFLDLVPRPDPKRMRMTLHPPRGKPPGEISPPGEIFPPNSSGRSRRLPLRKH